MRTLVLVDILIFRDPTTVPHQYFYYARNTSGASFLRIRSPGLTLDIPVTSMKRMIEKYKIDQESEISTFRDSGSGRPRKLDKIESEDILTELAKPTRDQHAPNRAKLQAIIIREVEQSSKRRNIANACPTIVPKNVEK